MNNTYEEILANIFIKKFNVNKLFLTISEICYDRINNNGSIFFDNIDHKTGVCIDFYLHNNNLLISKILIKDGNYNTIQYLERMFYLNIDILKIIDIINNIIVANNNLNQTKKYLIAYINKNNDIIIHNNIVFNINKYIINKMKRDI